MEMHDLRSKALTLLQGAAAKSKRTGNVPFPKDFVIAKPEQDVPPPLARMIQGGRGGAVRLALYMCVTMMATSKPYDLKSPPAPRSWARMLAIEPEAGKRRVSRNLKWLADNSFIKLEPRWGAPSSITLLNPAGDGGAYVRPAEQGPYIGVPIEFWTQGWILELSPTATALLLVLRNELGGRRKPRYVTAEKRHCYGLSPDTWTKATKELAKHSLLKVGREPLGSFYDYQRLRNTYWVEMERLKEQP